jgi:aminoglycoside phosphotransferase (APT) family kinase protein
MDNYSLVKKVFERDTNTKVLSITKCEGQNLNINNVFKIGTEDKTYIFKIYHSTGYPEKDKMVFISKKLIEHNIPHARTYFYNGNDADFQNGYIIEECLPGVTADKLKLTENEICNIYSKLALLTSEIHKISFTKYGFIINGIPDCYTYTEHIRNEFKYGNYNINNAYTDKELAGIKRVLIEKLQPCDVIQPCLCHMDIQLKNLLVSGDSITLIDWDDSRSFPAVVDIARLTLLIELAYDNEHVEDYKRADIFKKAFLDNYKSDDVLKTYHELESALHVWHGLILLNFWKYDKPQFGKIKARVDKKIKLLN